MVVQGTDVADKGCGVHNGGLALPQHIVPVRVRTLLLVKLLPLGVEEEATVLTGLDPAGAVHRSAAGRPRVVDKAGVVRRLAAVLTGVQVGKTPLLVLVPADVADFREGVLVGEGEVKDVGGAAGALADVAGVVADSGHVGQHAAPGLHVLAVPGPGAEVQGAAVVVRVLAVGGGGAEAGGDGGAHLLPGHGRGGGHLGGQGPAV